MSLEKINCSDDSLAEKLESTRWALDFSWSQICNISKYMEAYTAKSGVVIFDDHETDNTMGIVVKGKIDIVKTEEGMATTIATLLPSQSFGEMSLIDGEPRSAKIVAASDVEILLLTKENLFNLVDTNPKLAFKLLWMISQMISQRLRKTSGNLLEQLNLNH
jgi:CRP/FNR family transcriptional regulator, cyclic AMP receptor protein